MDEIWLYVAKDSNSLETADRFVESLTSRFTLLARNPFLGRKRDTNLRPGMRSFPVRDYLIHYRVENEDVLILHVVHGSRDIVALFGLET